MKFAVCLMMLLVASITMAAPLPVVLWHGMGDSCCFPFSMGKIGNWIKNFTDPNLYIHSIRIGKNVEEDVWFSYFENINKQVDQVCAALKQDANLKQGFNAVGFSQGGLFLRAYVQRCNDPPVHNLITLGSMHQGVFGFPRCPGLNSTVCEYVRRLLDIGVYWESVQHTLVQAEYWHDPLHPEAYVQKCIFLPDINQEHAINETYRSNLKSLNKFVMARFLNDTMVQPIESSWFGFYADGNDKVVVPLRDSKLYKNDVLGLQELDKAGKLAFLSSPGDHLQFTEQWFIDNIIPLLQ